MDATWNPRGVTHGMSHVVHLCEWLTLSQVSSGEKKKEKKIKKIKKIMEMKCGMWRKEVEVSLTLINSCRRTKKGEREEKNKEKRKRKKREKGRKKRENEN